MRVFVYPSNRCNMACRYCGIDLNRGPAVVVGQRDLRDALEWVAETREPRGLSFLGGEPLLHFSLLRPFIAYARSRFSAQEVSLDVTTNGYYLDEATLAFLVDHEVDVSVSLDGGRAVNDRHRVFFKDEGRSAFDAVLGRVQARSGLCASMVVSPDTAARFSRSALALYREGFDKVGVGVDYSRPWRPAELRGLSQAFERLKGGLRELSKTARKIEFYPLRARAGRGPLKPEDCDVVLGADGYFYASHAAISLPYGANHALRVGHPLRGIGRGALEKVLLGPVRDACRGVGALAGLAPVLFRNLPGALPAVHDALLKLSNPAGRIRNILRASHLVYSSWGAAL